MIISFELVKKSLQAKGSKMGRYFKNDPLGTHDSLTSPAMNLLLLSWGAHKAFTRVRPHSARVVHSTSYSDVTSRGRPDFGPYVSFPDVLLRPGVRRTSLVRLIRTQRRCNVFSTSATNNDVRKTYVRAQIKSSSRRLWTSCRVGPVKHVMLSLMASLVSLFYGCPPHTLDQDALQRIGLHGVDDRVEFYMCTKQKKKQVKKIKKDIRSIGNCDVMDQNGPRIRVEQAKTIQTHTLPFM